MANKTLSFEILRPVIIDAVKTETPIKGVIDKALDEKAAQAAYNETIGDEEHHNRKIDRAITAYAETLVAQISDVLSGNSNISTDYSDPTKIVISVSVDGRFNPSFSSTLARLGSEFITNKTLVSWYGSIQTGANQVAFYESLAQENIRNIRRCFSKLAPGAPMVNSSTVSILDSKGTVK